MKTGFLLFIVLFSSCDFVTIMSGSGTHGSIKEYSYNVNKDNLEAAILMIIDSSDNIVELENDMTNYFDILINAEQSYVFVFRYYGDKDYWAANPHNSAFFIAYLKKKEEKIFRSNKELSRSEKEKALEVFEKYFVSKLDENLRVRM